VTVPLGIGLEEPPDRNGAFPRLNDDQRARLLAVGELRKVVPGEVLFTDGDDSYDFFVVESGAVAIVRGLGDENHVIAVHGPHRFLGELNLLTGGRVYLSGVVRDAGEVIQVPIENLRRLVADDEELSNLILRAFMARRSILIEVGGGVRVIGSRYSLDARRLREFLARNRVPYHWVDLEEDEEAERSLRALGVEPADTPVVAGGQGVLQDPSNAEVAEMLGLEPEALRRHCVISWWSAAGRRGCRRPCTERPKGSIRRRSTQSHSAGRPARRLGSRTISGSRRGSRAAN
jgi:thioredoxin reductase (NADPH)